MNENIGSIMQENGSEQENKSEINLMINEVRVLYDSIEGKNPKLFEKMSEIFDLKSLSPKNMQALSEKEQIDHIEWVKEELQSFLPSKDKGTVSHGKPANLTSALTGLLFVLQLFSANPALAEEPSPRPKIERKQSPFAQLQELQIEGRKFRLGVAEDKHGEFGSYKQFVVLDQEGNNVFPKGESTWAHELDGFYIGNLLPGKEPEIMVWHRISDAKEEQTRGNSYQWSKQERKFVPYYSNLTDEKFAPEQKKEIRENLLKETQFSKSFKNLQKFLSACREENWKKINKFSIISKYPEFTKEFEETINSNLEALQNFHPKIYEARIEGAENTLTYFLETSQGKFLRIYSTKNGVSLAEGKTK